MISKILAKYFEELKLYGLKLSLEQEIALKEFNEKNGLMVVNYAKRKTINNNITEW
ncbi:MAG: hypothetical protein PHQ98_03430 [Candidatus ainarchaeum sp.]|nr:hypothetical protein [Candidatus ainarchaeum sp.]